VRVTGKHQQFIEIIAFVFRRQFGVMRFPILVVVGVKFRQFPGLNILCGGQVGEIPANQVGNHPWLTNLPTPDFIE